MSSTTGKTRQRCVSFSGEEKLLIANICAKYKHIIENKKTDHISNEEKNKIWEKIATEVNAIAVNRTYRTSEVLKRFYENRKREVRKVAAEEKNEIFATGGGPSKNVKKDVCHDIILSIMNQKTVYGLENEFDGDAESVEEPNNVETVIINVERDYQNCDSREENDIDLTGDFVYELDNEHSQPTWKKYIPANLKQPITPNLENPRCGPSKRKNNDEVNSEPACFQQLICPLVTPGHSNELLSWLRTFAIIKLEEFCTNMTGSVCVRCSTSNRRDLCQCSNNSSLIFTNINCSLRNAIRILLGWCKGSDIDTVANTLGVKSHVVGELYIKAALVAENYMKSNIDAWQIGGPGVVVIIDVYPEGCANSSQMRQGRPMLCISEVKSIPQRYWLEPLEGFNLEQTDLINQYILQTVQSLVLPGSVLIIPSESSMCSYKDFESLRSLYPTIVTTTDLAKHDNEKQTVFANLETIWKSVLDVCEEAQFYSTLHIRQYIISHLWRTQYGGESLQMLLHQLGSI